MNKESNTYTILYAAIMVIIVAVALAFTSQVLKAPQKANEQIDKMQQILRSVNLPSKDKKRVMADYRGAIVKEMLVSTRTGEVTKLFEGEQIARNEVFEMNMKNQFKYVAAGSADELPIFVANIDGTTKYILPLYGAGLWNAIWGYIAVDGNLTVYGADFSHAGETPGLGAEIATPGFSSRFIGKKIGTLQKGVVGIAVLKKGQTDPNRDYVDGISGGTLTGNGVNAMLHDCLVPYSAFLMKIVAGELPSNTPMSTKSSTKRTNSTI